MKIYAALVMALALSGCSFTPVETRIAACPMTDIASITFYAGPPSEMASLKPDDDTAQPQVWTFGMDSGSIYLKCDYTDGTDTVQKLPSNVKGCRVEYRPDMTPKDLVCDAEI